MLRKFFNISLLLFTAIVLSNSSQAQQPSSLPGEKVYVHTDKDFYLAGEIIWFRVFVVNDRDHKPMNVSKVTYVEVFDQQQKAVMQGKIEMTSDGGSGSFYIPLTVNSGNYVLRAYTNWMKNGGPSTFFEKSLSLVNTIKGSTPIATAGTEGKAKAAFYPEGGSMLAGVNTRVGFQVLDKKSAGVDARGILTDAKGDTVLEFKPERFGIGSFNFTPEEGNSYKALILLPGGNSIVESLPKVESNGYALSITDNNDGRLRIAVRVGQANTNSGERLTVLLHSQKTRKEVMQGFAESGKELVWFISKKELSEGINHFTTFNEKGTPVSERLFFILPSTSEEIKAEPAKKNYTTRELASLNVSNNAVGDSVIYNCAVSVFLADDEYKAQPGIGEYLFLTSELTGRIESPSYYFSGEPGVAKALDNLMLTHGWRRFSSDAKPVVKYVPEMKGHFVRARVINKLTDKPAAGIDCFLSVPSYPFGFYVGRSDNEGIVKFDVSNYYGPGGIIAQVAAPKREQYRIDIVSPFSESPVSTSFLPVALSVDEERLLERSIAMQAPNIYLGDSSKRYTLPQAIDTMPFYGKAEFTYNLDEYKRFTTMEEVLREYVMPINVRVQEGGLRMAIYDELAKQFYTDDILVLLDGIPIYDINKIFSYDPLKIKRLDVVPRRYLYGSRVFSGIANFESSNKEFDGYTLDPALLEVDYEGLQLQREFYSPVHSGSNASSKRIPDFRTTLYWQPVFKTEKSGTTKFEFYTSDIKGRYIVEINGIGSNGKPVHAVTEFNVE